MNTLHSGAGPLRIQIPQQNLVPEAGNGAPISIHGCSPCPNTQESQPENPSLKCPSELYDTMIRAASVRFTKSTNGRQRLASCNRREMLCFSTAADQLRLKPSGSSPSANVSSRVVIRRVMPLRVRGIEIYGVLRSLSPTQTHPPRPHCRRLDQFATLAVSP